LATGRDDGGEEWLPEATFRKEKEKEKTMKRGGKAFLVLLFVIMLASLGFAVEKGTLLMRSLTT
jgi:hypothetical protein